MGRMGKGDGEGSRKESLREEEGEERGGEGRVEERRQRTCPYLSFPPPSPPSYLRHKTMTPLERILVTTPSISCLSPRGRVEEDPSPSARKYKP
jgi:hypothetical protein